MPVNAAQLEESSIEPGAEQMLQIKIERLEFRVVTQMTQQLLAHGDQSRRAAGRHVHPPQKFLARRLGRLRKSGGDRRVVRPGEISLGRLPQTPLCRA